MLDAIDLGIYALLGLAFIATFALSISFLAPMLRLEVGEPPLPRARATRALRAAHRFGVRRRLGLVRHASRWHIALLAAATIAVAMVVLLQSLVRATT